MNIVFMRCSVNGLLKTENDNLDSRFLKLRQDLQEEMVLPDGIHQKNQQKALEFSVSSIE